MNRCPHCNALLRNQPLYPGSHQRIWKHAEPGAEHLCAIMLAQRSREGKR